MYDKIFDRDWFSANRPRASRLSGFKITRAITPNYNKILELDCLSAA